MPTIEEIQGSLRYPTQKGLNVLKKSHDFLVETYSIKGVDKESRLNHLLGTAKILAELGLGPTTIAAGMLHDVLENGYVVENEIDKQFEKKIVLLVQGVTALSKIKYIPEYQDKESMAKFFLASAHDLRVLVIKLAEILDVMRTIGIYPKEEQLRLAQECLDMYVPLAERLGTGAIKRELETLSFEILKPKECENIRQLVRLKEDREKKSLANFKNSLLKTLAKENLRVIKTDFRLKSVYSIYKKMELKENIEQIYDIRAFRIVVESVGDCYRTLGIVNTRWQPLPDRVKDYIALPKPDGYRSLHTTVFIGNGHIAEIQIRTPEMHERAEIGIISHTLYKQKEKNPIGEWFDRFFSHPKNAVDTKENEEKYKKVPGWIKRLVDVTTYVQMKPHNVHGPQEKFLAQRMFVFDEKGAVVDLPKGATVVDFAFVIDPDNAANLSGATVNGKFVSIQTNLKNDDTVVLHLKKQAKPRPKWLEYAKTPKAKTLIREHLKNKYSQS